MLSRSIDAREGRNQIFDSAAQLSEHLIPLLSEDERSYGDVKKC